MSQKVDVELNLFYMHYNDAKKLASWAETRSEDKDAHPSIYARHSIISAVFASEALINRVIYEFGIDSNLFKILERCNILDKWYLAPFLCLDENNTPAPFNKGEEPFQSFKELIDIRNWLAHPKVEIFLDAETKPNSSISIGPSNEEYPWIEMLKGNQWKQVKIPKNPFEINFTHAQVSLNILERMIEVLNQKLHGKISEQWLEEITVKDRQGLHKYRAPVFTIWGGYGGINR